MSKTTRTTRCRNCRRRYRCHARGLCRACYLDLDIRRRFAGYPTSRPQVLTGPPVAPQTAEQPTPHQPGTEGKLAVMAQRAAARLPLFHPQDAASQD
jgi:hypothetical protein